MMEDSAVAQPMSPKSPPGSLDLYGKRRQMVKVQALEREIHQLQEELKSVERIQPASRYCKEVDDFVEAKADPFLTRTPEVHKSHPLWNCFCCSGNCCLISSSSCCSSTSWFHGKSCNIFENCISCKSVCARGTCSMKTSSAKCCGCKGDSCFCGACSCVRSIFQSCTKKSCSSCIKTCCQ